MYTMLLLQKKRLTIIFSFFIVCFLSNSVYARDIEVYFTPSFEPIDKIISLIDHSKRSIDVAMYSFTSRPLAQSLINAKKRGVKVRLLLDGEWNSPKNKYSKVEYLLKNGINIRFAKAHKYYDRYGIMHNKFAIFDDKIVETGSLNWTAQAPKANDENVLVIDRVDIANVYKKQFEELWNQALPAKE
ncbi:phospholipase D family protein [Desulfurella sp.]|uniref:phospholipase D family nuclease n=1 Tax=Desulfurella sp. TaxID=1962857 RepID=UPI003D148E6E